MFVFNGKDVVNGFTIALFQSCDDTFSFAAYGLLPFYHNCQDNDAEDNPLDDPDSGLDFVRVIPERFAVVCDEIAQIRSDEVKVIRENRYGVHDESLVVIDYGFRLLVIGYRL